MDFTEAQDSEWQWHQLGHMQVCTLLQMDSHTRMKYEFRLLLVTLFSVPDSALTLWLDVMKDTQSNQIVACTTTSV